MWSTLLGNPRRASLSLFTSGDFVKKILFVFVGAVAVALLTSCAGQRQGVVCDEIEYRLNSMSYSEDQRVFMEEELRACREDEQQKKKESAETRRSIYERFASSDSTAASADGPAPVSAEASENSEASDASADAVGGAAVDGSSTADATAETATESSAENSAENAPAAAEDDADESASNVNDFQ